MYISRRERFSGAVEQLALGCEHRGTLYRELWAAVPMNDEVQGVGPGQLGMTSATR